MRARHVSRTWQLFVPCTQYTRLSHHHMYGVSDTYAPLMCLVHTSHPPSHVRSHRHVYLTGVIDMYTSPSSILHLFVPAREHTRDPCMVRAFCPPTFPLVFSSLSAHCQRPAQTASAGSRARSRATFFFPALHPYISFLSSHLISLIPPLAPRVCVVFWGVIARSHCLAALLGGLVSSITISVINRVSSIALLPLV